MRNGLTIIELIFVIIILGVLASVILPKLAATRDDAKIAVMAQQVESGIIEILIDYSAHGVVKNPYEMSHILAHLVHIGHASITSTAQIDPDTVTSTAKINPDAITITSVAQIPGSVGQLTIYTKNGMGSNDHPFIFDINQTTLVFKYGSPCTGAICRALQKRVSEGNYSLGGSQTVF